MLVCVMAWLLLSAMAPRPAEHQKRRVPRSCRQIARVSAVFTALIVEACPVGLLELQNGREAPSSISSLTTC